MLHSARERSPNHTPITTLIAAAVRQVYGHIQADSSQQETHKENSNAFAQNQQETTDEEDRAPHAA